MSDFILEGIKNIRSMHSSAAPARIEGLCELLVVLAGTVEELKTQLAEEQETLDELQEQINEWKEIRRRESSSTLATLKAAHRNRKGA